MGAAVGAALGAKLAHPDRIVIAEVGDGAFGATNSAIATAVEYDINAIWVVMNNFGYSSINVYQAKHGLGNLGTSFQRTNGAAYNPNFAKLAEAYGALGIRVEAPADLRPALKHAIRSERPAVVEVLATGKPRVRASGHWDVNDILSGTKWPRG
jgi:acetolactate synthase-1/2/3 large subunit